MSVDIEEIPTIESAIKVGRRSAAGSQVAEAYPLHPQQDPGNILETAGGTAGLQLIKSFQALAFPSAADILISQRAFGVGPSGPGPSYTFHNDCQGYDYNGPCNEACYGFAPDHMDPFFCATCAEQKADPTNNPAYNWHFVGSRGQIQYKDREPDVCWGKDAWKWTVQGDCGNCHQSSVFRCHDGYKKLPDKNYWEPTICQGLVSCDNKLTPCP
jgi:hypothetical protein